MAGWRFLWAKRVRGFDPAVHCARCLVGPYVQPFGRRMAANQPLVISAQPGAVLYFCGVSLPYRWESNLHLAVEARPGASCEVTAYNGDMLRIEGAAALPFDDSAARARFPGFGPAFLTCRNFQFAAQHFPA